MKYFLVFLILCISTAFVFSQSIEFTQDPKSHFVVTGSVTKYIVDGVDLTNSISGYRIALGISPRNSKQLTLHPRDNRSTPIVFVFHNQGYTENIFPSHPHPRSLGVTIYRSVNNENTNALYIYKSISSDYTAEVTTYDFRYNNQDINIELGWGGI
jgi:hypothetical protein